MILGYKVTSLATSVALSLLVSACLSGYTLCLGAAATVNQQKIPDLIVVVYSYHWLASSEPHLRKDYTHTVKVNPHCSSGGFHATCQCATQASP